MRKIRKDPIPGELDLIIAEMVQASQRRLHREAFLCLDGRPVGRTIETYFLRGEVKGWSTTLRYFFEEVVLPLRGKGIPEAYNKGRMRLLELGKKEVFDGGGRAEWEALLAA